MAVQKQSITIEVADFKAMVQGAYGFGGNADNVEIKAENEDGEMVDAFAVHLVFETEVAVKKRGGRRKKDESAPLVSSE